MAYTVAGPAGHKKIKFNCQRCQADLTSPLEEAGERFPCPTCGAEFVTPGMVELQQQQHQQATAARLRREAAEVLAAQSRQAAAARAQSEAADASGQSTAAPPPTPPKAVVSLAYAAPAVAAADSVPEYADILHGNRMLRIFAGIVAAFGWVAIVVSVLGLVLFCWQFRYSYYGPSNVGLVLFVGGLVYALPCFVVAIMLRMYGALAVAVRDIARTSYRP